MKTLKTFWIRGVKGPASLFLILVVGAFPICGYTDQGPKFVALLHGDLSHAFTEKVELFVPAGKGPYGLSDMLATVTIRFELTDGNGNSLIANKVDVEANVGSTARFDIELGPLTEYGQSIYVNGNQLCCVNVAGLRVNYQYSVKGSQANFLAGGEFPIPTPYRRGDNIAVYYVDGTSGATHGSGVYPIAVLDDRSISNPSN